MGNPVVSASLLSLEVLFILFTTYYQSTRNPLSPGSSFLSHPYSLLFKSKSGFECSHLAGLAEPRGDSRVRNEARNVAFFHQKCRYSVVAAVPALYGMLSWFQKDS